jgi:hypothetical protein
VQKRLERLSLSQYQVDQRLEYPNRQCRALSSLQESGIGLETRISALLQYAEEADLAGEFLSELQYLNDAWGSVNNVPRDQWDAYRLQAMENVELRMTLLTTHHELGAFFLCSSLMTMGGNLLSHNIGAADSFLNNLRWFEEIYPHFNIPELSWITAKYAEDFAGRVGNTKSVQEYGKLKGQALANLSTAEKTTDGTLKMAAKWYSEPTMFDHEYRLLGHHHLWPRYLLKILKLWVQDSVGQGTLPPEDAAAMFQISLPMGNLSEAEDVKTILDELSRLDLLRLEKSLFGSPKPVLSDTWDRNFELWKEYLMGSSTTVPTFVRQPVLRDLQDSRCANVATFIFSELNDQDPRKHGDLDYQLEIRLLHQREREKLCDLIESLDPPLSSNTFAAKWNAMNSKLTAATTSKSFMKGLVTDEMLLGIQVWMENFLQQLRTNNLVPLMITTLYAIATVRWYGYLFFDTISAFDARIPAYRELEKLCISMRTDKSTLKGWKNIDARSLMIERWSVGHHQSFAIAACTETLCGGHARQNFHLVMSGQPENLEALKLKFPPICKAHREVYNELILWAQKAKTRGVAESLGTDILLPAKCAHISRT